MTIWAFDDSGNRASAERWGSVEAAQASLKTLYQCRNCINCLHCANCAGCTNCTNCASCTNCSRCLDCTYCKSCNSCVNCTRNIGCDLTKNQWVRVPVSDPRNYTWLAVVKTSACIDLSQEWVIRVGCRIFTIPQARNHWLSGSYNGPSEVKETIGFALGWVESQKIMSVI